MKEFRTAITDACESSEVAGFKSVICYRTGLAVPLCKDPENLFDLDEVSKIFRDVAESKRLEQETMGPAFLHYAVQIILNSKSSTGRPKPIQFHTGLGTQKPCMSGDLITDSWYRRQ